jgi:ribosomal protein S18 acetylase RimI-like enzyme
MRELRDRDRILDALARDDRGLHIYEIGDLDDFFFPWTRWLAPDSGPPPVALLYTAPRVPVLLALTRRHGAALAALLAEAELPPRMHAHLSPGLVDALAPRYRVEPHGPHDKMLLRRPVDADAPAVRLGPPDRERLLAFYRESYPGNWFEPRMLETGQYHGVVEDGVLRAAGGVHVYSPRHAVAAIGNVAVDPAHRGRGLGRAVTAAICRSLAAAGIADIGLNVLGDNRAAIACYRRLGFEKIAEYDELLLTAK